MLKIGITSRALFDLDESHKVYEKFGLKAYRDYQISRENILADIISGILLQNSCTVDP